MKYIGFYDTQANRRNMCLAATNKMDYIAEALNNIGLSVEFISTSTGANIDIPETIEKINDKTVVHFFRTYKGSKNKLKRIYHILKSRVTVFLYCLKEIKRNEQVLVYHSLDLMRPIYFAKKLKGFRLVLEVEEFYNDVHKKSEASVKMENRFIHSADKYIFPTELLNKKFNKDGKPYAVICGTYKAEENKVTKLNDGKIHCVYAGTFDPRKGGAAAAVASAEMLPENYHIHIIGFGNADDIANMKSKIEDINAKSKATVTYDGLLSGEEYIKFIQNCDIGLSTQNPDADFNATSFPSKILSYMANGLRVVSIKIPAIATSPVGDKIYYYEKQTPEEIARAIRAVDMTESYDSRGLIKELDLAFQRDLRKLLEETK